MRPLNSGRTATAIVEWNDRSVSALPPTFEDRYMRARPLPCPLVAPGPVRRVRPLERLLSEDRDTAKQAALTRIEICACVQGTAVVPQQEVTRTPNMFVDKAPLLLMVK